MPHFACDVSRDRPDDACFIPHVMLFCATVLLFNGGGCATVDAHKDFERVRSMVVERAGVTEVYDPELEEDIEERVSMLLDDGLTTSEAVEVALLNNRSFQSMFLEIGVSRSEVVQSGLLSNPSLGLSLRFPEGGGRSNLTVALAQQIADIWQIPIRKRIAAADLERTILTVARRANELAAEVRRQCYRLLALEHGRDISQTNLDLVTRSYTLAQDRYRAGDTGVLDVKLAQANVFEVQLDLMSLEREIELARADLTRLLGLSRSRTAWTLKDTLPTEALPKTDPKDLTVFAMRRRFDARALAMHVRAAEAKIKKQIRRRFPSVVLGAELERQERRALPGRKILADTARTSVANGRLTAPSIQSRGQRARERSQIIDSLLGPTLEITLPIWDQNQAQIAKARFQASQARKAYEDLLDSVARDIGRSFAGAQSTRAMMEFYEQQSLPHARENVEVARRMYHAGEQSILVLIQAQKALITQRRAYLDAQRTYATAMTELRLAVGGQFPTEVEGKPSD